MNKNVSLALTAFGLTACVATAPEITYFEQNFEAMSTYNSLHGEKIGELTNKINEECVFKKMEKKNISMSELISIPLNGTVIYDITADGTISSALYVTRDKGSAKLRKQECIESVALGYSLPPSTTVKKVFSRFNVNVE
ncbi:hypothetical protein KO519_20365 [Paraglaciecola agarilytica]|uniref:hypothetical protein n=1 Tax=Paraglaciecola chathamensis TaxID=368405 RepID=UPI001C086B56|nr:hypothetical protein [Paraglaciecola agarilytica]MBU3020033.1 hypothetical protein [Paraglaciecola agarilytica]